MYDRMASERNIIVLEPFKRGFQLDLQEFEGPLSLRSLKLVIVDQ
jgi:hypothetical protein